MNIAEYKEVINLIQDDVKQILKKSVSTFKHFCSFQKTSNILDVYYNLEDFDKWVSIKTLINQRNAYHQIHCALSHVEEIRSKLEETDTLLTIIDLKKHKVISKINKSKEDSNNEFETDSEEEYIKYLEDKVDNLESKISTFMKLVDVFVYDKYKNVFDILLGN